MRNSREFLFAPLCLFLLCALSYAQNKPELRLPDSVSPTSYRVDLTLDPLKEIFAGEIVINIDVKQELKTIWLNATDISVSNASLNSSGRIMSAKAEPSGDDFLALHFASEIPKGPGELVIRYTGTVRQKTGSGVFLGEDSGNKYIYTQFEPTDARGAFPCFDEPSYKVPWQLTLHVPTSDTAISNTPIERDTSDGSLKTYLFKQTKPLPSYLVAFAVGPFEYVAAGKAGKNQFPVRIVVPKGRMEEVRYAAEVTATILTRLENYFGIPFPYDKSDQVAVCAGFGGAMENPGMVTYAQTLILANPTRDTIGRQRSYASVAAHELAHQWFGDLVTTAWWNDIWLNEAFATWMEQKLIAEWNPEWKTRVEDVDSKLYAENQDSLVSARMIRQEIKKKDDINNAFDAITYQKGAAVIGMFENFIGPAEFRKGVQSYLTQYAFRNATAPEFLDAISSSSKRDVSKPFSTFLNQAGVPMVSAALDCRPDSAFLHLQQHRSLSLGTISDQPQTWSIPICMRYPTASGAAERSCMLMEQSKQDIELSVKSCPAWVQMNDKADGYYQVAYQGDLSQKLSSDGGVASLSAPERVDLLGNTHSGVAAGRLPFADELKLVEVFHADPDRHVVDSALNTAIIRWVPANLQKNYQTFFQRNFGQRAHQVGWIPAADEPDDISLLRPNLVSAVATYGGDPELAKQGQSLAQKWLQDHLSIDANMVEAVLRTAAYYGDRSLMDRYLAAVKQTKDRQIRRDLELAMMSFRDPVAISVGMQAVLAGEIPLSDGGFYPLVFSGQNSAVTRKMPFEFIKAHYDELLSKNSSSGIFDYDSLFPRAGSSFCDAQSKAELKSFFEPRVDRLVGARHNLDETLEGIDICIATHAAELPSLETFLRKY
jgi:alanyl aminopeptidase